MDYTVKHCTGFVDFQLSQFIFAFTQADVKVRTLSSIKKRNFWGQKGTQKHIFSQQRERKNPLAFVWMEKVVIFAPPSKKMQKWDN